MLWQLYTGTLVSRVCMPGWISLETQFLLGQCRVSVFWLLWTYYLPNSPCSTLLQKIRCFLAYSISAVSWNELFFEAS